VAQLTHVLTGRILKTLIFSALVTTGSGNFEIRSKKADGGGTEKTLIAEQIAVGKLAETWLAFQQPCCKQKLSPAVNENLGLEEL
jgi:hypothetical protein